MTNAIHITSHGDASVLQFTAVEVGPPGDGEAVVRHTAIGVNFIDIYHRAGLYPIPAMPSGLGVEAAGVVESVGANVVELCPGDRVAYAGGPLGAYAERRCIAVERLVKLPDDIADEVAAAGMLKGMTVEYLIRRTFPVQSGQTVLWHAAAGGVGLIACQWLSSLGVRVIGTVGSDAKARLARANGCADTILYREEDFVERVRALTAGSGVPVVYDSVGKATFLGSLDCLSPRGLLVGFGNASGKPEPIDVNLLSVKGSLFLTRPTLFSYTANRKELLASAAALFEVIRCGKVNVHISLRLPLREAADAHRRLEARETTGSIVLLP
jgi:NADPH:quinone reductase